MARTTTREIIKVCTELARLDRKGKMEVLRYLHEEMAKTETTANEEVHYGLVVKPTEPVTYAKEGDDVK